MLHSRFLGSCLLFAAALAVGPVAHAQPTAQDDSPAPPSAAAPAAPAAVPSVETEAPPPIAPPPSVPAQVAPPPPPVDVSARQAAQSDRTSCVLGAHPGFTSPDAMTAAGLVCESLRDAGAELDPRPIPEQSADGRAAYRVELHPLGKIILLKVSHESPQGHVKTSRSMQLAQLEEVPVAAPRIAQSLISGKPLADTAQMNTLVGEETRAHKKKYGELSIGAGVFGFGALNTTVAAGYGIYGQIYYEVPAYAVGAELRLGGSDVDMGDSTLTGISLSGRYFLNEGDISPFIGGGFGVLWLQYQDEEKLRPNAGSTDYAYYGDYYEYRHFEGSGLEAHAEIGVEFLRMHDVRMDVLLRIDAPVFMMRNTNDNASDRYALPISLMGSFSFE